MGAKMIESAKKLVKPIKIFYIIALCMWICNIAIFFYNIRNFISILFSEFDLAMSFFGICLFGTIGIISGIQVDKSFNNYVLTKDSFHNAPHRKNLIINFICSNVFLIVLIITFYKITPFNGLQHEEIFSTLTFPGLPCLIGHILYVILICKVLKQEKIDSKDYDEKLKQEKRLNKNIERVKYLLEKVGSKFFVKYYNYLKNNSILDIIDVIEEQYSEETKKERISYSKTIFTENLQSLALEQILNDKNTILDEKMLKIANELYAEKNNLIAFDETKFNTTKPIEEKKLNCDICKYNINETSCEIYVKKPKEKCEDFSQIKGSNIRLKSGFVINCSTNADLLNYLFNKEYKGYMKCTYNSIDMSCILWMIALDGKTSVAGFRNYWLENNIIEEYVGDLENKPSNFYNDKTIKPRYVFEKIIDNDKKYFVFKGIYQIDIPNSYDTRRVLKKVSSTATLEKFM